MVFRRYSNQKRILRKSERMWKKFKQPEQHNAFKDARNQYNYAISCEKRATLSAIVENAKGDSKKLYRIVSESIKWKTLCQLKIVTDH